MKYPKRLVIGLICLFSHLPFVQAATDCAAVTQIPRIECEALVELYNSTDGANWKRKDNWNETNTPCGWDDVRCSDGHVIDIYLYNNQLSGPIPDSLGNLSILVRLYLFNNQLSGPIPDSLGNLSNLRDIRLHNNQLSSPIPDSLGSLSNLKRLELSSNQLCGNIPLSLMDLGNLTHLRLQDNHLTASDPELIEWLNNLNPNWVNQTTGPEYCQTNSDPLLITINSFNATRNNNKVKIKLVTGSETNTAALQIHRAPAILQNLQQIQEVCRWDGVGTNSGSVYSCKDENAPASVVYWPVEIENDGTTNNYLEFMTTVQ